jgi:GNAT superfamily N-acetyltransferase
MPRERIAIRRATLRDLPTLVRQRRGMFVDMGYRRARQLERADQAYARWVRRQVAAGRFVAFLGVCDGVGAVAGGAVWLVERQPRPGFDGGLAPYLLSMYTDPEYRGRGLARRIVAAAMRWCRAHGYRTMSLHASPMGRPLYEKMGWKRTREYRREL